MIRTASKMQWGIYQVAGVGILLFIAQSILSRIYGFWRLRKFGGPISARLSELWLFKATVAGALHEKSLEVIEKYGGEEGIAQVGPNLLMTTNAAWWKSINEDRAWKKGSWYPAMQLDPGHDSAFSTQDDSIHDKKKSQLIRGVSI